MVQSLLPLLRNRISVVWGVLIAATLLSWWLGTGHGFDSVVTASVSILVVAFVGSMQTFLNIAVWVMLSEIFPLHVRGFAIGLSVFCLWIANALLGLFFPTLVAGVGITGTFFLFGVVGIAALIFIYTQVPETRGRTLEALEEDVTTGAIYLVHKK